jgi:hypothetical protein
MKFDTSEYEFTHGRKPKGEGNWGFWFHRVGAATLDFAPGSLSFTAAKAWAKQTAKDIGGVVSISVAT